MSPVPLLHRLSSSFLIVLETNMGFFLFSVLCLAVWSLQSHQELLQLEMDQAIPMDEYAVGYDCTTAREPRLVTVCQMCDADAAYTVFHGETSYLTGLYQADQDMLTEAVRDVMPRLPISNYTLAFHGQSICIAAHDFESRPNFPLIFHYFSKVQERVLHVPELFTLKDSTELEYIAFQTYNTSTEYQYSDLTISYRAQDVYQVSGGLELGLERVRVEAWRESQVSYVGSALIDGQTYPFEITVPYDREPRTSFTVSVNPLGNFTALRWAEVVDSRADCVNLVPIPDLSNVTNTQISLINLLFTYRSQSNSALLLQSIAYFPLPELSPFPLLSLTSVHGQVQVDTQQHQCSLLAIGEANYTYPLHVQVISTPQEWYMVAGNDNNQITIQEIENSFYKDFFMGFGAGMVPKYANNTNEVYVTAIYDTVLSPYTVRFLPGDQLTLNIRGETSWAGAHSTLVEINVGWVRQVVESVVLFQINGRNDFIPNDPSLTIISLSLISSTANIDLALYPQMQGLSTSQSYPLGLTGSAQLAPNSACDSSDFCGIIAGNSEALEEFYLEGAVVNDRLSLQGDFPRVALAEGLMMEETALTLDLNFDGNSLYISGGFTLQSDSYTTLHFTGRLSNIDSSAVLYARSDSNWTTPMAVERVFVGSVEALGLVTTRGLNNSTLIAPALVGTNCQETTFIPDCFPGSLSLFLNPSNFTLNSFTLRFNSMSLSNLLTDLLGFQDISRLPMAINGLDLQENSFDLVYLPGEPMQLYGPVRYYGVPGWLSATIDALGTRHANITINLDEFTLGNGNILFSRRHSGALTLDIPLSGSYEGVRGRIEGRVFFWDMDAETTLEIDEMGMRMEFGGWTGSGMYEVEVEMKAERGFGSMEDANVTVSGRIDIDQLSLEESAVQLDLEFWLSQGLSALQTLDHWKDNATLLETVQRSYLCPEDFCPNILSCQEIPAAHCAVPLLEQSCVERKTACESISWNCTQSAETCISSHAQCITFDNGACVDWVSICDVKMNICSEWTEVCHPASSSASCGTYSITPSPTTCSEWSYTCIPTVHPDSGCTERCQQTQSTATQASNLVSQFMSDYTLATQAISGFRSMLGSVASSWYPSDLFSLSDFTFTGDLSTPGIGTNDVTYIASFDTTGGVSGESIHTESSLLWSFDDRELNELSLLQAVKTVLIDGSNETLVRDLITTSPLEVALERIYTRA